MSLLLKFKLAFAITCCLIQLWAVQATNYCDPALCGGKKHIACNNKGAFSTNCGVAKVIPLTLLDRQAIMDKHNYYRNLVAQGKLPGFQPAVRMATMTWDNELAYLAVLNVKQCRMQHDACRKTTAYPKAGQNLSNTKLNATPPLYLKLAMQQIQQWYDENKYASMANITNLLDTGNFMQIGHFTAMMEDKNCRVGCGILRDTKNGVTTQYMACDYAYTNVIMRPVYIAGPTASKCTTGKNPLYPGLCSVSEKYVFVKRLKKFI